MMRLALALALLSVGVAAPAAASVHVGVKGPAHMARVHKSASAPPPPTGQLDFSRAANSGLTILIR